MYLIRIYISYGLQFATNETKAKRELFKQFLSSVMAKNNEELGSYASDALLKFRVAEIESCCSSPDSVQSFIQNLIEEKNVKELKFAFENIKVKGLNTKNKYGLLQLDPESFYKFLFFTDSEVKYFAETNQLDILPLKRYLELVEKENTSTCCNFDMIRQRIDLEEGNPLSVTYNGFLGARIYPCVFHSISKSPKGIEKHFKEICGDFHFWDNVEAPIIVELLRTLMKMNRVDFIKDLLSSCLRNYDNDFIKSTKGVYELLLNTLINEGSEELEVYAQTKFCELSSMNRCHNESDWCPWLP